MKKIILALFITVFLFSGCRQNTGDPLATAEKTASIVNSVRYAKGLEIYKYNSYTIVKVTRPWPQAKESFTYVMLQKGAIVPDSLKKYTTVNVPVKSLVATSTTYIPSLEMLGVENTLTGFAGTGYVSSVKTRALIDSGKIKEAGANESLNAEVVIDLDPDAVVAFGINSNNKTLANLEQAGIKVLYNGDWTEQSPLGKAEWIKFFGALYGLGNKADRLFSTIEKEYAAAQELVKGVSKKPTVLAGAMLGDQWLLPEGNSWGALFFKDAGANYLWQGDNGTGSSAAPFEQVLEKGQNADFWIGPSQFTSLKEMLASNPHYAQFKAFKTGNVYSYSTKKGTTGGLIYYELAPNRPDLVLKDLGAIFHPETLPGYKLQFFEKLK